VTKYSWFDLALWTVAVLLLIPFLLRTVGDLVRALEPLR
jgi:hypothetical protein